MISSFVQSAVILMREGLEAILVVAALAAYLDKAGARDRLTWLYAGAVMAIAVSLVAAWAFEVFNNGMHDDLLEAAVILCAAALMLYVSGWLFLRQDPRAWQGYLQAQVDEALSRRTGIAIALVAFLAVFREGAETVLFVHALARTEGGWSMGLLAGLAAAAVVLALLFLAIGVVMRRLPLRPVFLVTSAFLFVMSIKFIGDALQEFQEQQYISFTEFAGSPWLQSLGLNPTLEAVSAQLVVMACAVVTVGILDRRARRLTVAGQQSRAS
jgi:high-affinity iron transporter